MWRYFPQHPRAWGHTTARKAARDSSTHIKRLTMLNRLSNSKADNTKTFGHGKFWDPVLTLAQPVRHVQIRTGICLAIRVKKLLVHLLEQQRPWSWLHPDASLAGKKGRQKTCCSGYASATSSRSIIFFFPVFAVTLIANDKGNLHSVRFPAHIWILYKTPLFLPLLPLPSCLPFFW